MKVEFESEVNKFINDLDKNVQSALEEIGGVIESAAARTTPVGKISGGKTKGAWVHRVDGKEVLIGNTEETAIWLELGTGDYALNGDGRKGGWWIPIGDAPGQISESIVDAYGFKIGYGKNGQKFAFTKGMKPLRILHNAVEKNKSKITNVLSNKLGGN